MNAILCANQNVQSSGIVTVYLLLIVFAVLGLLVVILAFGQKGLKGVTRLTEDFKAKRQQRKAVGKAGQPVPPIEDAPLAIEEGISPQVVAAIMAAVTCCMEQTVPGKKAKFVVRKITRR